MGAGLLPIEARFCAAANRNRTSYKIYTEIELRYHMRIKKNALLTCLCLCLPQYVRQLTRRVFYLIHC